MYKVNSKDGTHIAYGKVGAGLPVILVDGAMCHRNFGSAEPLASQLSSKFTVYTYDRRGRGESSDTLPYAIEKEIEDIEAIIDEAGEPALVYGISSGAVLALHAAGALGSKVRKLALYEAPISLGEEERRLSDAYTEQLTQLLSEDRRGDAIALFMKRVGSPDEAIAGMRQAPIWPIFEAVAPTLAYDNAILTDESVILRNAADVNVPSLVIDGGASPAFMREAADWLAKAIPSAQRRTLEGQTHEVDPAVIASVLADFFAD